MGDEAWFRVGGRALRVRVGRTSDGVELLETRPPWSVSFVYDGAEYVRTLFARGAPEQSSEED